MFLVLSGAKEVGEREHIEDALGYARVIGPGAVVLRAEDRVVMAYIIGRRETVNARMREALNASATGHRSARERP